MSLRKILFAGLLVAVLIPAVSQATITRVIGMGGEGANLIMHDAYNYTVWPQLVRHYGMQSGAEFYTSGSGWGFKKAYVNYDFGDEKSVMQIALDKTNTRMFGWAVPGDLAALDAISGGYNKLSIIYGRPIGEDMLIGAAINYGGKSYKTNADGGNIDNSYSEFGLKVGLTALEEKLDAAVGFSSGSWTMESGGVTNAEADGASTIVLAGRYWHELNEAYSVIPNLSVDLHSDGRKDGAGNSASLTGTDIRIGVGNNWTPKEKLLALTEVGLFMSSTKTEVQPSGGSTVDATDSMTDIYWRIGVESKIFAWLKGRFGAERAWRGMKLESVTGEPETATSMTYTYLGATCHWGRFVADVLVNPSFLGYGPNFVSGYDDMIFTRASLKINFDKE